MRLSFAAQRKPECLFVRLSRETARDPAFLDWLDNHLRNSRAEAQRLCFQITEEIAASHGATARQVALRFLVRRPSLFAIPKASSAEHASDNAAAGALRLSEAELARIDAAFPLGSRPRRLPML